LAAPIVARAQAVPDVQIQIDQELARTHEQLARELARVHLNSARIRAAVEAQLSQLRLHPAELAAGIHAYAALQGALPQVWAGDLEQEDMQVFVDGDRGWLGVSIAEVSAEKAKELKLPAERGVVLTEVNADGPAGKAGLKAGDVITEFNGQRVEGTAQFRRLMRETPAGRTVQLGVWREGRSQNLSVQLGNYPEHAGSRVRVFGPKDFDFKFEMPEIHGNILNLMARGPMLGISAEDLEGQLGNYFGAPDGEGVLVRDVKSGSAAEKAGLKAGDVITKVDGTRVRNLGELREQMRAKRESKTVALGVIRKGSEMSLNVEVEQPKPATKKVISRRISI
jgi:serine protease Do